MHFLTVTVLVALILLVMVVHRILDWFERNRCEHRGPSSLIECIAVKLVLSTLRAFLIAKTASPGWLKHWMILNKINLCYWLIWICPLKEGRWVHLNERGNGLEWRVESCMLHASLMHGCKRILEMPFPIRVMS